MCLNLGRRNYWVSFSVLNASNCYFNIIRNNSFRIAVSGSYVHYVHSRKPVFVNRSTCTVIDRNSVRPILYRCVSYVQLLLLFSNSLEDEGVTNVRTSCRLTQRRLIWLPLQLWYIFWPVLIQSSDMSIQKSYKRRYKKNEGALVVQSLFYNGKT